MHLRPAFTAAAIALIACAKAVTEKQIPFEFGKVKASLNGNELVGAFTGDSVIAIYSANEGQIQIAGDRQVRGRKPSLRVYMRCATFPMPGIYPIRGMLSPVHVEAFLGPTGWERAWPLHGSRIRAFQSDSMPSGQLELDTIDTVGRVIKGRFEVALRSFNRVPAETLSVRGAFFGRLIVDRRSFNPFGWAPIFDLNCDRIRDAVAM